MSQVLFNRTVKTNIIIYPTDGSGRDCYITFNNAGFWKDNIKRYTSEEKYKRGSFARFRSIRKIPPIWNYHADGTGRDTYVLHDYGGLINHYKGPRANFFRSNYENNSSENIFNNRMNNNSYLTRDEKIYQTKLTKIQKDVVNRLYYKPRKQMKLANLRRENSYGNVFSKLKLEPIKISQGHNDIEKNAINDTINERYFMNNNELKNGNYLNNINSDEKMDVNEKSRNKLSMLQKYKIKCLSNDYDSKYNHYPFNQFSKKMNLTNKNSDKKYKLFNY